MKLAGQGSNSEGFGRSETNQESSSRLTSRTKLGSSPLIKINRLVVECRTSSNVHAHHRLELALEI